MFWPRDEKEERMEEAEIRGNIDVSCLVRFRIYRSDRTLLCSRVGDHYWTEFKVITWPSNLGCRYPANDAPLLLLLRSRQSLRLYISLNVLLFYFSMPNCCLVLKILENLTKEFEKNNRGAWKHRYEIASFVVLNVREGIVGTGRGNVYVLILNWCSILE